MDNEIPNELFETLGRVSAYFSELELAIVVTVSVLLSDGMQIVSRLIGGDSFDVVLEKLSNIFILKVSDELLLEKFDKLKKKLKDINEKRNRYLHSNWLLDNDKKITRMKFKRKIGKEQLTAETESVSIQTLKDFVQEITSAQREIGNLMGKISDLKKAGKLNE